MYFLKLLFKDFYHLWQTKQSREFLKLAFKYGDKKRYRRLKVQFFNYGFDIPDAFSFLWQFYEIFVEESYLFQAIHQVPVIFDCGANVGTSCVFFKEHYPQARIKAFEADPGIYDLLRTNLNRHNLQDIDVVNKAVWIHNEGLDIVQEGADGASAFTQGEKVRVPSIRLSELLDQEPYVDMLKIDIEGAEVAVLEDCRNSLTKVQHLFVEYHSYTDQPVQQLDAIFIILKENGFRYYVKSSQPRSKPFINRTKPGADMDLQLDIFAYKS